MTRPKPGTAGSRPAKPPTKTGADLGGASASWTRPWWESASQAGRATQSGSSATCENVRVNGHTSWQMNRPTRISPRQQILVVHGWGAEARPKLEQGGNR